MTRTRPHTLTLRPLAYGSLTAVCTATGAVLTVLPPADALTLVRSLTLCVRAAEGGAGAAAIYPLPRQHDVAA